MKIQFKRLFNSKSIVVIQFNSIFNFRHFETPFTPWLNMNLSCFFESLNQKESIMIKCTVENKLMCSIIRLDSLQINHFSKFMIFSSFWQNSIQKIIHLSVFWQNSIQIFISIHTDFTFVTTVYSPVFLQMLPQILFREDALSQLLHLKEMFLIDL